MNEEIVKDCFGYLRAKTTLLNHANIDKRGLKIVLQAYTNKFWKGQVKNIDLLVNQVSIYYPKSAVPLKPAVAVSAPVKTFAEAMDEFNAWSEDWDSFLQGSPEDFDTQMNGDILDDRC